MYGLVELLGVMLILCALKKEIQTEVHELRPVLANLLLSAEVAISISRFLNHCYSVPTLDCWTHFSIFLVQSGIGTMELEWNHTY